VDCMFIQTARTSGFAARLKVFTGSPAGLRRQLVQESVGSFALNLTAKAMTFATTALLARLLSAEGYGVYAYAMAIILLLGLPTSLGLPALVVRYVAAHRVREEWGLMRGLLIRANQMVLLLALIMGGGAAAVAWLLVRHFEPERLLTFWVALALLPLTALGALRSAALCGLHYVVLSQLPEKLIRPGLFIIVAGTAYLVLGNERFTPAWAMGAQVTATAAAFFLGAWLLLRRIPTEVRQASPAYEARAWVRALIPLALLSGIHIVTAQTDIVMLGALQGVHAAGVYRVAARGAELVSFGLVVINTILAPTISRLYASKEMLRLQRVITTGAWVALLLTLPMAIPLMLFGSWILGRVFGAEFSVGGTALTILCGGQIVNAGTGSVGLILTMTGHGRETATGIGIAALLNIILNAVFIPFWGVEGASAATAISLVTWNVILAVLVHRRLGLHSGAWGQVTRRGVLSEKA
jgi:O-antigen/teichoic acid export membrane protein